MTRPGSLVALSILLGIPAIGGLSPIPVADPPDAAPAAPAEQSKAPTFEARVLEAAANYKTWTRISDEAHWAPTNCRAPVPEGAQLSDSKDQGTHGRKLYFLFAKDASAYRALGRAPGDDKPVDKAAQEARDVGQVLVKESWTHKPVDAASVPVLPESAQRMTRRHPPEYAFSADGKAYRTDALAGLFVMLKLDPKTPDTDQGWVYATVSTDNKVTSIGKVASCMECHIKTATDRQFGPAWGRPRTSGTPAPESIPK